MGNSRVVGRGKIKGRGLDQGRGFFLAEVWGEGLDRKVGQSNVRNEDEALD